MKLIKDLREKINNGSLTEFDLQGYVEFFAYNIDNMPLGSEVAFKEYIRKGANHLKIDLEDLQAVYNSFRNAMNKKE
jgi:hypothetical protein